MKIFHTADWHLGKLVHGIYMTNDQTYILKQFIEEVKKEQPDVIIIAGDLYDRAIPPPEAIELLNNVLDEIVLKLEIPIIAIAGNHDSPGRLNFGSRLMEKKGFYIRGQFDDEFDPIVLHDEHGPVHFHPVPYCDPSVVREKLNDETIKTHDDAARKIVEKIKSKLDKEARHVYIGHAFVTPYGREEDNTSESEKPLSIGGVEFVNSHHFSQFHYTALGHLHRAHYVVNETIRYAGSLLKYSISEEKHKKGFYIVQLNGQGDVTVEQKQFAPKRDMRTVRAKIDDILKKDVSEDYVYIELLDEQTILQPMEKVRSVFPNAMHVSRKNDPLLISLLENDNRKDVRKMSDVQLFQSFYEDLTGEQVPEKMEAVFQEVLEDLLSIESETSQ